MNDRRSLRVLPPARQELASEAPAAREAEPVRSKAPTVKALVADEGGAPAVRGASAPTAEAGDLLPGDSDLLTRVLNALYWNVAVPSDGLRVTLEEGWVTISGEVAYSYQKSSAEADVRRVSGVRGVTNAIEIKPTARQAAIDAWRGT
jgi:BON domain